MAFNYKLNANIEGVEFFPTKNPLAWGCNLTPSAKKQIKAQLGFESFFDGVYSAYYHLKENADGPNPAGALDELKWVMNRWFKLTDDDNKSHAQALEEFNEHAEIFISDLSGEHIGDCTAFPSSCTRCHVENLLGVDTLPIGKSAAYRIRALSALSQEQLEQELAQSKEQGAIKAIEFVLDHRNILAKFESEQNARRAGDSLKM